MMSALTTESQVVTVRISNDRAQSRRVVIEPWGRSFDVPPGGSLDIDFEDPRDGQFEIETTDDCDVVYGWENSTLRDVRMLAGEP